MGRNIIADALVLQSSRFGEYHKRLLLLTPDTGLISAVAYGAFKSRSKLSGVTESFTRLRAYLYFEPVKKQYKLNDAEAITANDGIRQNLKRYYTASLLSEMVKATYAGGDEHTTLFPLLEDGFRLLSSADDHRTELILVQLLMRFLEAIGYPPLWESCDRCNFPIPDGNQRFVSFGGNVLCDRCRSPEAVGVTAGGYAYLLHTLSDELSVAMRVDIAGETLTGVKQALLRIVQRVVETPLRSIKGAESIL